MPAWPGEADDQVLRHARGPRRLLRGRGRWHDYFERAGTPFIIAVNCFDGATVFDPDDRLVRYVMTSKSQASQSTLA